LQGIVAQIAQIAGGNEIVILKNVINNEHQAVINFLDACLEIGDISGDLLFQVGNIGDSIHSTNFTDVSEIDAAEPAILLVLPTGSE